MRENDGYYVTEIFTFGLAREKRSERISVEQRVREKEREGEGRGSEVRTKKKETMEEGEREWRKGRKATVSPRP